MNRGPPPGHPANNLFGNPNPLGSQ
jgi:hypothetical protein